MKITTKSCCSTMAMLFLAPFVNGQAAVGGGVAAGGGVAVTTAAVVAATPVTPALPTMVWVTATANGVPSTFQSAYTQTFSSFNGAIASPKVGSIGLGSITGVIGVTSTIHKRSAEQTPEPEVEKRSNNRWRESRVHPRRW